MPRYRFFDYEAEKFEPGVEVLEKNGNLRYVELEDGRRDWVTPQELDQED